MNRKIVCTIITKNYLAYARALATSITEHNPDIKLYVLLADRIDGYFAFAKEPFELIQLEDLPEQETIQKMCFYYTPFELCCALRGMLHNYIYEINLADLWIFLDSDILVFNSLEEIFQQLETHSILLTPHLLEPINQYNDALEVKMLAAGIYNAGFLAIKRSEDSKKFIEWFKSRLTYYSFQTRGEGDLKVLFADQPWLNFVPHFFNEVGFVNHPGANVAYWNLVSRNINKLNNTYYINEKPILFIHFTGWNISNPENITRHFPSKRYSDQNIALWQEIGGAYKKILLNSNYEDSKHYPYAFSSFTNGKKITPEMRFFYYKIIFSYDNKVEKNINPFSEYGYLNSKFSQENKEKLLRKCLRIYEYDYFESQLAHIPNKPITQEVIKKIIAVYKKIIKTFNFS